MPQIQGVVAGPNASIPDGTSTNTFLQGKSGEMEVAELHGKWYTAAYRNRVFFGSSLIAGVIIPVNTTTSPTFTLFNPLGSGVNLELISFDLGFPAAAATVVGTILASVATQTPTSVTSGGVTISSPIGAGGVAQGKLYTAATITAITTHLPLFTLTSTADAAIATHYEFDGKLILAPGGMMTITSTPVQTAVGLPSLHWAEFPV